MQIKSSSGKRRVGSVCTVQSSPGETVQIRAGVREEKSSSAAAAASRLTVCSLLPTPTILCNSPLFYPPTAPHFICTRHIQIEILPPFYATRHFFTRTPHHTLQSRVSTSGKNSSAGARIIYIRCSQCQCRRSCTVQEKLHCSAQCRRSLYQLEPD